PTPSYPLSLHDALPIFGSLAEGQRLGLREHVRHQHVVVATNRIQRFRERDEIAWNEPRALVDQLIERMLAVGAGLAPVDGAGVRSEEHTSELQSLAYLV